MHILQFNYLFVVLRRRDAYIYFWPRIHKEHVFSIIHVYGASVNFILHWGTFCFIQNFLLWEGCMHCQELYDESYLKSYWAIMMFSRLSLFKFDEPPPTTVVSYQPDRTPKISSDINHPPSRHGFWKPYFVAVLLSKKKSSTRRWVSDDDDSLTANSSCCILIMLWCLFYFSSRWSVELVWQSKEWYFDDDRWWCGIPGTRYLPDTPGMMKQRQISMSSVKLWLWWCDLIHSFIFLIHWLNDWFILQNTVRFSIYHNRSIFFLQTIFFDLNLSTSLHHHCTNIKS